MSVVVQISDTHFGTEQPPVVEALLELVARIRPALAILSGDITQRARRAQFGAAQSFAANLQASRVIAIPGNHDIPLFNILVRAFMPYTHYQRVFGANLEPQFESDDLFVQCVNTTRPYRHKDGEVSVEQADFVAARLRAARPEQLRIVVTHQPVQAIRASDVANLLIGRDYAVRQWCDAGVDLIVGGHIHLPYVRPLSESYPDLKRQVWNVQAGTAVSRRIREGIPNSVNVIRHAAAEPRCVVERWDFDAGPNVFACVKTEQLAVER